MNGSNGSLTTKTLHGRVLTRQLRHRHHLAFVGYHLPRRRWFGWRRHAQQNPQRSNGGRPRRERGCWKRRPDNDGLSGMGSSNLSITVGATDDKNTIDRSDDTVASYSSRGPRRDNGDGNPLNELKPEVSAPGTNIVQAEGCVTSGGCVNLAGGSAEDNGYTGRGSGTSYATPSLCPASWP